MPDRPTIADGQVTGNSDLKLFLCCGPTMFEGSTLDKKETAAHETGMKTLRKTVEEKVNEETSGLTGLFIAAGNATGVTEFNITELKEVAIQAGKERLDKEIPGVYDAIYGTFVYAMIPGLLLFFLAGAEILPEIFIAAIFLGPGLAYYQYDAIQKNVTNDVMKAAKIKAIQMGERVYDLKQGAF